ncbi:MULTISPECIES: diacylglycerol/polyprenol kinase family protein [Prochlorococcus]|uniref:Phytol kinase n=1 Tax=Prochlorococcus marinus str. MIT 9116 TaxID=167544 RepID=A0A0A1ZWT2_PROMR|nr:dolichol kinase [Prochlorococcus marinus]KGF92187.1 phytol kinase [Prochlorococcus marinus str. MIT 9107]KGF92583.1 phytol kinase [Prochlorococcus marinus str. MIT 9116]KGF95710.1 phytol kinase [Prochlorococcus marinus str. MIT 9123]
MIKFTIILLYLFFIFLISIVFKRFNEDSREIVRKIIHIGIGPLIPIALFLKIDQNSALIFTGIISLTVLINYVYKILPIIEDIERKSYGTLFYCLSLFILISLFWNKDPFSLITGFFIMTFGDGLAALIGKSFNSRSWIFFKQKKSLFGTLTMFLTSLLVVFSLGYAQQSSFNISYFAIALLATVLEQFSVLGIDNFIVPITSALCFNFFISN